MPLYSAVLTLAAFVGAVSAGFLLAQSPRKTAPRLAALLVGGAAWWAYCEARWNAAPDAAAALHWMRLSTPGWAFIGGVLPHLVARSLDVYPSAERDRIQRRLWIAALLGYAVGVALLPCAWIPGAVHGEPVPVPWGWGYAPGPVQLAFFAATSPPLTYAVAAVMRAFHLSVAVAPRAHRVMIRVGILIPVALVVVTDVALPSAGIAFPRLGSVSYAIFGSVAVATGLRYGFSFFTPPDLSEAILETLKDGVALVTRSGLIRLANRGLVQLTGRTQEELVGCELPRVLDWQAPRESLAVDDAPGWLLPAQGPKIPVLVSAAPLRDWRSNPIGVVIVVRDQREVEELRRHMLTQARLAAVGGLAAGLAHEINNPLAFVRSNLAQLGREWKRVTEPGGAPPEERAELAREGHELIAESLDGVDRAADIVRGVRRFTHAGPPVREPADPNPLVEDALAMLRPRLAAGTELVFHPGDVPPVCCAPQELRQVFLNLAVNAVDAVAGEGRVTVTSRRAGDAVEIAVEDDGCGIEPASIERIFDPFFTTKAVGEGTGLGLGLAWNVVDAHGGHIAVESRPGVGSTFRVVLPAAADAEGAPEGA